MDKYAATLEYRFKLGRNEQFCDLEERNSFCGQRRNSFRMRGRQRRQRPERRQTTLLMLLITRRRGARKSLLSSRLLLWITQTARRIFQTTGKHCAGVGVAGRKHFQHRALMARTDMVRERRWQRRNVSGVAALLFAREPSLSVLSSVLQRIVSAADPLPTLAGMWKVQVA